MKLKSTIFKIISAFLVSISLFAQDGANDTTFNPVDTGYYNGVDGSVNLVIAQPDDKIIVAGEFERYQGATVGGIVRINDDETADLTFNAGEGANAQIFSAVLQPDGKIIVVGDFTTFDGQDKVRIARLNANGSLDETFNTGTGANGVIYEVIMQPDGKIIVAGNFTSFNNININRVARLNADGSVDASFNSGLGANNIVYAIALMNDGKIVLGGAFTNFNSQTANTMVCLNANGSVYDGFNCGTGADFYVREVKVGVDGNIYVGGIFSSFSGQNKQNFVCLNSNGTINSVFQSGSGVAGGTILSITILPDDKILIGGQFSNYNGTNINDIARLNSNGTLDSTFHVFQTSAEAPVFSIALLTDERIVAGGYFKEFDGVNRNSTVMLNPDGQVDETFDLGPGTGADNTINAIDNYPGGKIVIAGRFTHFNGEERNRIALLSNDGVVDTAFNPMLGANGVVNVIKAQADGKILISGYFTKYNDIEVSGGMARINANGSLDESFSISSWSYLGNDINYIAVQPDGKILISGALTINNNGQLLYGKSFCRLNSDGTLDPAFILTPVEDGSQASKIILLPDGKILIGADSGTIAPVPGMSLFRLNANGTVDTSFAVEYLSTLFVEDMDIDAFGNIMVSGYNLNSENFIKKYLSNGNVDNSFSTINNIVATIIRSQADGKILCTVSHESNKLVRFDSDGTIDETFDDGDGAAHGAITGILFQQDKAIIAGGFNAYNSVGRNRIARLHSVGTLSNQEFTKTQNNLIAYKEHETVNVISERKSIIAVQLYDISGKLLAEDIKINALQASIICAYKGITIVKTTLDDNTSVVKKIY